MQEMQILAILWFKMNDEMMLAILWFIKRTSVLWFILYWGYMIVVPLFG
jgi:hypothetical protein